MTCSESLEDPCDSQEEGEGGGISELDGSIGADYVMMAVNGSQAQARFVTIDSLYFSNCSKKLQFNCLSNVTITNSTFE